MKRLLALLAVSLGTGLFFSYVLYCIVTEAHAEREARKAVKDIESYVMAVHQCKKKWPKAHAIDIHECAEGMR